MHALEWLRLPGDALFIVGGALPLLLMWPTVESKSVESARGPQWQAYMILRVAFVVAPITAGLDKFFHLLVDWDKYLASIIATLSAIGVHGLKLVVGAIGIVAV